MEVLVVVLKIAGLFLAVGVAVLAYVCYSPVPRGVTEPWKSTLIMSFIKFADILGAVYCMLGMGTYTDFLRAMCSVLYSVPSTTDPDIHVTCTTFHGVRVWVYQPMDQQGSRDAKARSGLVYFHGGGWTLGTTEGADPSTLTHTIAKQSGSVVVSVDYRLAPEFKFPTPFEDCVTATKYFLLNCGEYNVDPSRVGVAGDSAGGNLAAAVALKLHHEYEPDLPTLKVQALLYPCLQACDFQTDSYLQYADCIKNITAQTMAYCWSQYLTGNDALAEEFIANRHIANAMRVLNVSFQSLFEHPNPVMIQALREELPGDLRKILDPYFAPLMAADEDMVGLPKTYVSVCEFDVLRDDGMLYAQRLRSLKVPVTLDHYKTAFHSILNMASGTFNYDVGKKAMYNFVTFLKNNLQSTTSLMQKTNYENLYELDHSYNVTEL